MEQPLRIALTASFDKGLFCNGLNQNIVFLAEMLEDMGHKCALIINHALEESQDAPENLTIVHRDSLGDLGPLDFVFQTAWVLRKEDTDLIKDANPSNINIHVHYGNRLLADIEQCKWDTLPVGHYRVDEVWVSPHYEFSLPYFKTFYKTPRVFILPYIWSPKYVDLHDKIFQAAGDGCLYDPSDVKNIAIVEPNLNMTKNCLPSILIVEEMARHSPDLFNLLKVYCTGVVSEKRYFRALMWALDLVKNGRVSFEGRKLLSSIFRNQANVIVSHQLLNGLNYTYLEAFHFNIPLVHNSTYIKDAGYYYPDYDVSAGATQLVKALTEHDSCIDEYRRRSEKVLWRYSPKNPSVQHTYRQLLNESRDHHRS